MKQQHITNYEMAPMWNKKHKECDQVQIRDISLQNWHKPKGCRKNKKECFNIKINFLIECVRSHNSIS